MCVVLVRNFVESHKIMMICWQNDLYEILCVNIVYVRAHTIYVGDGHVCVCVCGGLPHLTSTTVQTLH